MRTAPRSDHQVNSNNCNDNDDNYAGEKVLFLHCINALVTFVPSCGLASFLSLTIDISNRGACYLKHRLVRAANNKARFPHRCDDADDAAGGNNLIADL